MKSKPEHYYIQGFAMVVSPGNVADCDIYFRTLGNSPQITGVDLFRKDRAHLGWVYVVNLDMEVKRAMLKYIRTSPRKWVRVHHRYEAQD